MKGTGWLYAVMFLLGLFVLITANGERFAQILGVVFIYYPSNLVFQLYRFVRQHNNRTIFEERHIEMSSMGVKVTMDGGSLNFVPWPYVVHCIELKRFYILYLNEGVIIPIDRCTFPDTSSEERFRAWLTSATPR